MPTQNQVMSHRRFDVTHGRLGAGTFSRAVGRDSAGLTKSREHDRTMTA